MVACKPAKHLVCTFAWHAKQICLAFLVCMARVAWRVPACQPNRLALALVAALPGCARWTTGTHRGSRCQSHCGDMGGRKGILADGAVCKRCKRFNRLAGPGPCIGG